MVVMWAERSYKSVTLRLNKCKKSLFCFCKKKGPMAFDVEKAESHVWLNGIGWAGIDRTVLCGKDIARKILQFCKEIAKGCGECSIVHFLI
jgi:hypothetical protein